MNMTKHENFLRRVLENPGKWVHLRRPKRKNNLRNKSDERSRKRIFDSTCHALKLMGLIYETKIAYFIKLKE